MMLRLVSCALRDLQDRAFVAIAVTTAPKVRRSEVFENCRQPVRGVIYLIRHGNLIVVGDDLQLRLARGQNRQYSAGK